VERRLVEHDGRIGANLLSVSATLDGAVAVVTGGAQGIGAAVVARLAEAGARVAVLDVAPSHGPEQLALQCDVSDEESVVGAVAQVSETMGTPTVAVLNAGIGGFSTILETTSDQWDRVLGVNLRGTFLCLRELGRRMVDGGGGSIVVTSSISAASSERGMAHYDASKAAVNQLVRVAARELGPSGVRVNAVAPGTTDTPLFAPVAGMPGYVDRVISRTPLGRLGGADDIADAVMALLTLQWVTGHILVADGGLSLFSAIDPLERR
jgi:3-oxoacyl-[acyl-carrier protein] reductase